MDEKHVLKMKSPFQIFVICLTMPSRSAQNWALCVFSEVSNVTPKGIAYHQFSYYVTFEGHLLIKETRTRHRRSFITWLYNDRGSIGHYDWRINGEKALVKSPLITAKLLWRNTQIIIMDIIISTKNVW